MSNKTIIAAIASLALFTSCESKYAYVETLGEEPKVEIISADEDAQAYDEAFNNFAEAHFYYLFEPFIKTKQNYSDYEGGCDEDGEDTGAAVQGSDDEGGNEGDNVIVTDDSENNAEMPQLQQLTQADKPSGFVLYKLDSGEAKDAAKKLKEQKISLYEFQKITQGKVTEIDLFEQQLQNCNATFKKVFDKNMQKLKAAK